MSVPGEVRVVDDVPGAFASLVLDVQPSTFALSGGGTAERCYARLAATDGIDWPQMDVLLGDERWVRVDDPDSNEGMARRMLLDLVGVRAIHSAFFAGETIEEAAAAYDALVRSFEAIDLIHLGLGPDGHTASLFPGSPALDERDRLVLATGDAEHPHPRITFTLPAIARGRLAVFTVEGDEKREAFERVSAGEDLPAAHVRAEHVLWLVDQNLVDGHGPDAVPG
jgi:6-phosphogluconolactonase